MLLLTKTPPRHFVNIFKPLIEREELSKLSIQLEMVKQDSVILKDYHEHALRVLWESNERHNSRQIWVEANKRLSPETISRASIINFLEAMRENGVLHSVERQ
jgi:Fe2+ or Zn2+ uptake regulation protein